MLTRTPARGYSRPHRRLHVTPMPTAPIVHAVLRQHGDITATGIDPTGRLFVEVWDADLQINRRFYEDRRLTRKREAQRLVFETN
jgi:hypothetical protein